ncbi:MAG: EAL domain-containing protein, partial [Kangiellaceae bacterium]|nr:EAL domain-containing protein [Kangiellaceae bacterium]
TINIIEQAGKRLGFVAVFSDITALKEQQSKLEFLALHDPLTKLPNRAYLTNELKNSISASERTLQDVALFYIDVDNFKHINDSLGHIIGDKLIVGVAERMKACTCIRPNDVLGRMSGDEFIIIANEIDDTADVKRIIDNIVNSFVEPFLIDSHEISVTLSIGISMFPRDAQDDVALLANGDAAMYEAKKQGRNTYVFYSSELSQRAKEYIFIENALRSALNEKQFFLQYQPQVSLDDNEVSSNKVKGIEALIRWQHPEKGLISPIQFIPVAEQSGMIRDIGAWVLNEACGFAKSLLDQGCEFGRIAVNVAASQFNGEGFIDDIQLALQNTGLPARYLELEITESFVMYQPDLAISKLTQLRELGISVAIDDFGTGYSSLNYLKKLPVDILKIDRSFIKDLPSDEEDKAISEAIIAMSNALELEVIAEGVETKEQVDFLRDKHCYAQGYYFNKPLSEDDLIRYLIGHD